MNRKLELSVKNREVVKSLIYNLERRFSELNFTFNNSDDFIIVELINSSDDFNAIWEKVVFFTDDFLEKFKRIDKKLKIETIYRECSDIKDIEKENNFIDHIKNTEVPGSYWIDAELFVLYGMLDKIFLRFARNLGAREVYAPGLISESNLEKCGYLPKERHQVSFLYNKSKDENMVNSHVCLSPAACLSTYPMFENKKIEQATLSLTMLGNVFRHEGGKFSSQENPFERMWEYQVREIIFFGDVKYKNQIQDKYFDFLKLLGKSLKFSFEIATAGDLFFHPEYTSTLAHQLIMKNKYEFVLSEYNRLALSSFNAHGDQFTRSFNIKGNSDDFQTFCIGFGLQRFIQGLMLTHKDITDAKKLLELFLEENP